MKLGASVLCGGSPHVLESWKTTEKLHKYMNISLLSNSWREIGAPTYPQYRKREQG